LKNGYTNDDETPIFGQVQSHKGAAVRNRDAFWDAVAEAIEAFTPGECALSQNRCISCTTGNIVGKIF
jgi:hypothetical protein